MTAPLFGKIGCEQWKPDLIWFDNLRAFTTPNYHVQKMFGNNFMHAAEYMHTCCEKLGIPDAAKEFNEIKLHLPVRGISEVDVKMI